MKILLLLFASTPLLTPFSEPPVQDEEIRWVDAHELLVEGQGWTDVAAPFDRLPARAEETVPKSVWGLSHHSAGIAVRFVTDASAVDVRWTLTSSNLEMPHMPATGVSGVDCYVRGEDSRWRFVKNGRPTAVENRSRFELPAGSEYLLYLPLYNGVRSLTLGVPEGKRVARPPESARSRAKPIVFYGTSITQGGCASRPGMAATAIVGRTIDRPVINLGFSGSGKMELEMAELFAELDPCVFVLDCLPNMTPEQVTRRVRPFVQRLREAHPETPIVLVEDPSFLDVSPTEKGERLRERFDRLQSLNVCDLVLLPNRGMLGSDGDGTVDRVHPNDLGMARKAAVVAERLRGILAPPGPPEDAEATIGRRREDGPTGAYLGVLTGTPWNHHLCRKCGSTDGGCYPKMSVMSIRTAAAEGCEHAWDKVNVGRYRRYIERRFPGTEIRYAD